MSHVGSNRTGGRAESTTRGGRTGRGAWSGRTNASKSPDEDGSRMIRKAEDLIDAAQEFRLWTPKICKELSTIFTIGTLDYLRYPTEEDIQDELIRRGQGPILLD